MTLELTEDDKIWRKQNVPKVSDDDFKKIIEVLGGNGKAQAQAQKQGKDKEREKERERAVYLQRLSNDSYYAEAVLIAGIPKFLLAEKLTGKILAVDEIAEGDEKIRPLKALSYINKPYSFSSDSDVKDYVGKAKKETLDSLYRRVKTIWKKYVDADDFHITICAADTIFTYYQNMAGMTHYLFFVGGPGSGKSNNLEIFHHLAYRNMTSTGITAPNIYAFYGGREEGIGTICEDEANDLDLNEDKMKFYKNGYTKNHPVFRQDDTGNENGGRIQRRYYTFGWKAFAAEQLPDSVIAMGFLERVIVLECVYGFPEYNITEVTNPMGDENFDDLLKELEETRNLLFIHRLLHHNDKFPNIKLELQLTGREKQLFKPMLRIFQNTQTQKELEPVISEYINNKRAGKVDSLHAYLYKVVMQLFKENNSYQLTNKQIWDKVTISKGSLEGEFMYDGKTSFMSSDFGKLTQNKITKCCKEIFGAKASRDMKNRGHVFDKKKMDQLDKFYNLSLDVKVRDMTLMTEMTEMTVSGGVGVGVDKHVNTPATIEENNNNENNNNDIEKENNSNNSIENIERNETVGNGDTSPDSGDTSAYAKKASFPSYVSLLYPPHCYRCDFIPKTKQEYDDHCSIKHPGYSGYPNNASLEASNLEPQDMDWEGEPRFIK